MPLSFTNPGEIDIRLVTTFGAHVKPASTSPIGYFGTGLKYAIAIILRHHGQITIWSGLTPYQFSTRKEELRGKEFELIRMESPEGAQDLAFTLELGKNWHAWMAYRELMSNQLDEGGETQPQEGLVPPMPGATTIHISCEALQEAAKDHEEIFLQDAQPYSKNMEALPGPSPFVYYRGVRVYTHPKPFSKTYNILSQLSLTEDRTALAYQVFQALVAAQVNLQDKDQIRQVLTTPLAERELPWGSLVFLDQTEEFKEQSLSLAKSRRNDLAPGILAYLRDYRKDELPPEVENLTLLEAKVLAKARKALRALGVEITAKVCVTEDLGELVLGTVIKDQIFLSRLAFRKGTKSVAGTLLEEHIHLTHRVGDFTRGFQDICIDMLVGAAEQILQEPL